MSYLRVIASLGMLLAAVSTGCQNGVWPCASNQSCVDPYGYGGSYVAPPGAPSYQPPPVNVPNVQPSYVPPTGPSYSIAPPPGIAPGPVVPAQATPPGPFNVSPPSGFNFSTGGSGTR